MGVRVLLVEPDAEQREQFLAAIQGSAFEVCAVANTNSEGIDLYDRVRPQLAVLPIVSGQIGAAAALDKLRKTNRPVKVVASYDVNSTHLLMSVYSRGAVAAIKQPFKLHRVVERLTFAIASEKHDKLGGPIVRLEHPVEVRYKSGGLLALRKVGFCERLGLTDMDLNVVKCPKPKAALRLQILLPPPTGTLTVSGVVEDTEMTRPDSCRAYIALKDVSADTRKMIEAYLVKAARQA